MLPSTTRSGDFSLANERCQVCCNYIRTLLTSILNKKGVMTKKAGTTPMSLSSFLFVEVGHKKQMVIPTAGISPKCRSSEFFMFAILLPYYSPECYTKHLQRDVIVIERLKQPMLLRIALSESKNQSRRIYWDE